MYELTFLYHFLLRLSKIFLSTKLSKSNSIFLLFQRNFHEQQIIKLKPLNKKEVNEEREKRTIIPYEDPQRSLGAHRSWSGRMWSHCCVSCNRCHSTAHPVGKNVLLVLHKEFITIVMFIHTIVVLYNIKWFSARQ